MIAFSFYSISVNPTESLQSHFPESTKLNVFIHCELLVKTTSECRKAAKSLIWVDKHHLPFAECFPIAAFLPFPPSNALNYNQGKNDTFVEQFNVNGDTLNSFSIFWYSSTLHK